MAAMTFHMEGKVVLVTGSGSGIGKETALRFADSGATVVVSDQEQASAQAVADEITRKGGKAQCIVCDVSQPDAVAALFSGILKSHGKLDIACNNAGIEGAQGMTADCTVENFDRVLGVNARGVWLCMKHEIPAMIKNGGGAIVNLSSIAGLVGFQGLPAYVASKHAVAGLTRTAALEYAQQNIRVNAVCPGPIMTPMLERIMGNTPGFEAQVTQSVPEHRIGEPADIANTILFLCSPEATYITGHCLPIDGGWVAQ